MRTILIGVAIVIAVCIWKFIIQPKQNEGKPIEPPEDYKTIGQQMQEQMEEATRPLQ